ncbi:MULTISPECIES: hypothetical protein [unclassified Pantoea]|uniref:hypothetical protein n=1 Tax=unclassified Pantoea TaxID=2630326 RepID=UPI0020452F88|nr:MULTISPECIES: hypothetical protein [unclassified Pantoea]MDU5473985.1 hypothetical protein [Pantoea sp.]DAI70413.1 MAG TPA: hypothetical protein [Bacteriophage sp.]
MKQFNETSLELVIKIPLKTILQLFRNGEDLGYLMVEETAEGGKASATFTPFTCAGLLDETRCFKCALESLIKFHERSGDLQPCDRRRATIEINVISLSRPIH